MSKRNIRCGVVALAFVAAAAANLATAQGVVRLMGAGGRQLETWSQGEPPSIQAFSGDDRFVYVSVFSDGVVPGDADGHASTFRYDRFTGSYEPLIFGVGGTAPDGDTNFACATDDGRFVFVISRATNLVPGTTTDRPRLYLRDTVTGQNEFVSVASSGAALYGVVLRVDVSDDGRYVLFLFDRSTYSDPNQPQVVYLRDRASGSTAEVRHTIDGQPPTGYPMSARISGDGSAVVLVDTSTNLVASDTNDQTDVFLIDLAAQTTRRVNLGPGGVQADFESFSADLTSDGRRVAFDSLATNLHPDATSGSSQVYVWDRTSDALEVISRSNSGVVSDDGSTTPLVSNDGRYVAFFSFASNLEPGSFYDVYRRDLASGLTQLVSHTATGAPAVAPPWAGWTELTTISPSGLLVAFYSNLAGYVVGDSNQGSDSFIWDSRSTCPTVLDYCTAKVNSLGCTPVITSSGEPYVTGLSDGFFASAHNVRAWQNGALLWSLAPAATPFAGGTRCVAPPSRRTPIQNSGGLAWPADCSGTYSFAFSRAYLASVGIGPGTTVYAQFWSRDVGLPAPLDFGLTNGLVFTTSP